MGVKNSKIIYITSVKGGTGKTNILFNLATTYQKMNKKVLLFDLDLYNENIAFSLKLDNNKDLYSIVDDLNNNKFNYLNDYIIKCNDNIDVISSLKDLRNSNKINSKYIEIILEKVKHKYDIILIDSNYMLNEFNLEIMDSADTILYVINNDPVCIKNMCNMINIFNEIKKDNYKIILNNSNNKNKNYYTKYDMNYILGKTIDYVIPNSLFDKNYDKNILNGDILNKNKNNKIYNALASSLLK